MIDEQSARVVANALQGLSDLTRMQILELLAVRPHHVSELAQRLRVELVNVSHHLGVMRRFGLVEDERQGRHKVYRLLESVFTPPVNGSAGVLQLGPWSMQVLGGAIRPPRKRRASESSEHPPFDQDGV